MKSEKLKPEKLTPEMPKPVKSEKLALAWLLVASIFRILPHIPNVSPVMSAALFAGAKLDRKTSWITLIAMMVVTDVVLSQIHGTAVFGWWSFFTFSGVLLVSVLGSTLRHAFTGPRFLACSLSGALLFWTWTNLGTWMTSGLYPINGAGLIACFAAAVPFLKTAVIGDLIWSFLLFVSYEFIQQRIPVGSNSPGMQNT